MNKRFGFLRVAAVLVGVVAILAVVGLALAGPNAKIIDSFATGRIAILQSPPADDPIVLVSTKGITAAGALGGYRTVVYTTSFAAGGSGTASTFNVNTSTKVLAISAPSGGTPQAFIKWDGTITPTALNTSGLLGADLVSGTNTGFVIEFKQEDLPASLAIRVYSNTNSSVYTVPMPGGVEAGSHVDYFVPFSNFAPELGSGVFFTSVGAVAWFIDGVDSLDFQVTNYEVDNVKDWGDLPTTYSTTLADNGPRHGATFLRLGDNMDAEPDGQFSTDALGDDNDGNAPYLPGDEDGVTDKVGVAPYTRWFTGTNGGVVNVKMLGCGTLTTCYLSAWIDWDNDGNFNQTGDQVLNDLSLTNDGLRTINFNIPTTFSSFPSLLYARFRLCSTSLTCNTYYGTAPDGEVEDYRWGFTPLAVTLNTLEAKADAQNNTALFILAATAVAALGLAGVALRRRHTA